MLWEGFEENSNPYYFRKKVSWVVTVLINTKNNNLTSEGDKRLCHFFAERGLCMCFVPTCQPKEVVAQAQFQLKFLSDLPKVTKYRQSRALHPALLKQQGLEGEKSGEMWALLAPSDYCSTELTVIQKWWFSCLAINKGTLMREPVESLLAMAVSWPRRCG